ncbi:MAG: riboflavin synthase [Desulfobacterales bacterium]
MFTGIIEGLGKIVGMRSTGQGTRLTIEAGFSLDQSKIGDSLSVNGACLTAVEIEGRRFEVDVSPETLQITTFDTAKIGDRVNLERSLRLSDRIDGHLVAGHIDGTGSIIRREPLGNAVIITIAVAEPLARYMIVKGSVAVDGISLTINDCDARGFSVSIIPYTAKLTTIGFKNRGDRVNIETDMIGKYVERFVRRDVPGPKSPNSVRSAIDREYLIKTGFID